MPEFETVTVVFTDIVDSTATLSRLSPEAENRFRATHFSLLRRATIENDGEEVKNLGDGVMAAFVSPSCALAAAVAMQQAVEQENRRRSEDIGLRVGLSAGEVHREVDDFFGTPVVEAARLCARCTGGQILLSALVKAMAGRRATQSFSSLGELELKGLPEPVATLELHWEPLPPEASGGLAPSGLAADALDKGRASFARKAWGEAYAALSAADQEAPLEPEDLERAATAAYLLGRDDDFAELWARAYDELARRGEVPRAVRCAFWLGFGLALKGDMAVAGGWLARAQRLLDESGHDCVEQGYLLLPGAMQAMFGGDDATAYATASEAAEIGARFGDANVVTYARLVQAGALTMRGEPAAGMALLDEAMVAVVREEVSPILAGLAYCATISTCQEVFDLRRAREWTAALSRWCACQPDLVTFRGQCLVHRSEVMQLTGAWPEAKTEAQRACERLADPPHPTLGMALYQRGQLHRLCGEYAAAEDSYREASEFGHEPQPGLAELRLAQGGADAAVTSLRRALDEPHDVPSRIKLLAAQVEILLSVGDIQGARAAADELAAIAAKLVAPLLSAVVDRATGAVLLAEGDARSALAVLRRSATAWRALDVPYEVARVRALVGQACRALGDEDAAVMELNAAARAFERLGATPELARIEELTASKTPRGTAGLTGRELEVLMLVAKGKTNREIAADLVISEHTVSRHVQNIFAKLGVSSRSAATAFAFEHDLV